uniref:IRS-type PTB domain-containing protein n=1 Tax=Angiostrongylus cantonensis TaxID=6313 RepID=A0A0K0DM20_ANGCA
LLVDSSELLPGTRISSFRFRCESKKTEHRLILKNAEIYLGTQKMRQEREASVQREMTQSCHPDMAQWKTTENDSRYDRSASATPFRASSVGPTMRRLEQVVSRLDDTSDNEAQYVFR